MLDAGDALAPSHVLDEPSRARWNATAELIVKEYARQGVDAVAVGDRDLALGREVLAGLAAKTRVPFIATNLVDKDGKAVFSPWLVVERAGLKILVLGLVGEAGQRMAKGSLERDGLHFEPAIEAARRAIAAQATKPDVVVVLSQLEPGEEETLAGAVPEVRAFFGGNGMSMSPDVQSAGSALSFNGAQKGKHVGFLTVTFDDPKGAGAPWFDPGRRTALEQRKSNAARKVESYERLVKDAHTRIETPPIPDATRAPSRPPPIEAYERQLAAAKAELALATSELEALGEGGQNAALPANRVEFQLVPMEASVPDDPTTKATVDEFRKTYPDPTKARTPSTPPPVPVPGTPPVPTPVPAVPPGH